jgi:hypothetical protein
MAMDGKTKTKTDNKKTLIYWEGTPRDPWHHWEGQSPYSIVNQFIQAFPRLQNLANGFAIAIMDSALSTCKSGRLATFI